MPAAAICALTFATSAGTMLPAAADAQEVLVVEPDQDEVVELTVGEAFILDLPLGARVSQAHDELLELDPLRGTRFRVLARRAGQSWLLVSTPDKPPQRITVRVRPALDGVGAEVATLAPGQPVEVSHAGAHLMLSGAVSDLNTYERVRAAVAEADPGFVDMLSVSEPAQVELEVLFAEVRRERSSALGLNLAIASNSTPASHGGMIAGQATNINSSFTPILSGPVEGYSLYGIINSTVNVLAMLNVLSSHGVAKIKAQPRLVSLSGQSADFHAGGETPIPVPNRDGTPSIQYKPYGVQLNVTPNVLVDGSIDLDVGIELSALDFAASVQLLGTTVPGLTSRSVHTRVRMESGMTFAIAGLIQSNEQGQESRLPGLGAVPVLGALFRQVSKSSEDTELLVYVTPRLVTPMAPGEVPPPPTDLHGPPPSDWQMFFLGAVEGPKLVPSPEGDVGLER